MNSGLQTSILAALATATLSLSLGACGAKEDKTAEDVKAIRSMMENDKAEMERKRQESIKKLEEFQKKKKESR